MRGGGHFRSISFNSEPSFAAKDIVMVKWNSRFPPRTTGRRPAVPTMQASRQDGDYIDCLASRPVVVGWASSCGMVCNVAWYAIFVPAPAVDEGKRAVLYYKSARKREIFSEGR